MERDTTISPCPVCTTPMTLRKTSAVVDGNYRKWFFFLYCSQCGYGPNNAFDTIFEAIKHWNKTALLPASIPTFSGHAMHATPRLFHS